MSPGWGLTLYFLGLDLIDLFIIFWLQKLRATDHCRMTLAINMKDQVYFSIDFTISTCIYCITWSIMCQKKLDMNCLDNFFDQIVGLVT